MTNQPKKPYIVHNHQTGINPAGTQCPACWLEVQMQPSPDAEGQPSSYKVLPDTYLKADPNYKPGQPKDLKAQMEQTFRHGMALAVGGQYSEAHLDQIVAIAEVYANQARIDELKSLLKFKTGENADPATVVQKLDARLTELTAQEEKP